MPHQCVKCRAVYADSAEEALSGCTCGSKKFFYLRRDPVDPHVALDVEHINVVTDGKYELDLRTLFKSDNLVVREEEGKYSIDLEQSFRKMK